MTFKEAEIKLTEVASGNYRSLQYYKNFSGAEVRCECKIYIAGEGWYEGKIWEEAFQNREDKINPKPFTEEGQPE